MVDKVRLNAKVGRRYTSADSAHSANSKRARAGFNNVLKNFSMLIDHLHDVSPQVMVEALEPTFELSKEYCPEETGALKASGYLEITSFRGTPTVEIGYGKGGSPDYAVTVHENLEWRHKAPTRAKWLQVALEEDAANIQDRIVSGYKRAGGF